MRISVNILTTDLIIAKFTNLTFDTTRGRGGQIFKHGYAYLQALGNHGL